MREKSPRQQPRVDYEKLASTYDVRYPIAAVREEREKAILSLAEQVHARRILEVGCGTGHWLEGLFQTQAEIYGLDFSPSMLLKAKDRQLSLRLVRGSALDLPFPADSFDLIYCVDALHHFGDPARFLAQAYRLLKPKGILAIIGNDPDSGEVVWYGYQYFAGVLETDKRRFPRHVQLMKWMSEIGFCDVQSRIVEVLDQSRLGREVYNDRFLKKEASSQFALLSDSAYQAGLEKIEAALLQADQQGKTITFESKWPVKLLTGLK